MDTALAASRLRSLATDVGKRSKTAVLREVLPDIERAIRAGVTQVAILDELRSLGLEMNRDAFRSAVRRLRAERSSRFGRAPTTEPTDFSAMPSTWRSPFAGTTAAGAMYDVEALNRLLRASAGSRASEVDGTPR